MSLPDLYDFLEVIIPPIITFLAGYVGLRYGLHQIKLQKNLDFTEKQLQYFYSPLLGIRNEIKAKGETRLKLTKVGTEVWVKECEKLRDAKTTDYIERSDNMLLNVRKEVSYNNIQLWEDSVPLFRKMLSVFRDYYYLSAPETRPYYSTLFEYVEIWNRAEKNALIPEVFTAINHGEENLHPFYAELEYRMEILSKKLKD